MDYKKWIAIAITIMASFLLTSSASYRPNQNQQFIRFHVIANSDSKEDQAIKLKVRDRLLAEYGIELGQSSSLEDSRSKIIEKIREIEKTAQEEADRYLRGYFVEASLGYFDFPTKAYGNMLLPAGSYEALRVTIGEAKGANWWCVMFPPLCFVDISHGMADGDLPGDCQPEDAPGEQGGYEQSIADLDPDIPGTNKIEYRFKILEWWDSARHLIGF